MPDYIEHAIDAGDLGAPFKLHFEVVGGEPRFMGGELGRLDLEPEQVIDALNGIVRTRWPFEAHRDAIRAWIDKRGWDALEARASAKDEAADEAYHIAAEVAA